MKTYRLPDGTTTKNSQEYVEAYRAQAVRICGEIERHDETVGHLTLVGFDPGFLLRSSRGFSLDITPTVAKTIVALSELADKTERRMPLNRHYKQAKAMLVLADLLEEGECSLAYAFTLSHHLQSVVEEICRTKKLFDSHGGFFHATAKAITNPKKFSHADTRKLAEALHLEALTLCPTMSLYELEANPS